MAVGYRDALTAPLAWQEEAPVPVAPPLSIFTAPPVTRTAPTALTKISLTVLVRTVRLVAKNAMAQGYQSVLRVRMILALCTTRNQTETCAQRTVVIFTSELMSSIFVKPAI